VVAGDFGRLRCPIKWCCGWPLSKLLQRKRGRVRCHLGVARRRCIGRQRGRRGPHNSGAADCVGRERVCRPGRHLLRLDRGADRGSSRLRAIKHRNGSRGPAGHQRADTAGKAGWKLLLQLSKQKAEFRLRLDFDCGLFSPARPRRGAPGEHPQCRTATCFGPRHRGFLWQCPWPGMGGHRDNPAGINKNAPARGLPGRLLQHPRQPDSVRSAGTRKTGSICPRRFALDLTHHRGVDDQVPERSDRGHI
jgi:hypothetical protein